jgi:hypothetical protein
MLAPLENDRELSSKIHPFPIISITPEHLLASKKCALCSSNSKLNPKPGST